MDDTHLLIDYIATGSPAAFQQLVAGHVDLVYSSAMRHVRDAHLAEDVTQAVFLLLARKAKSLRHETVLAAWLLTTTRYASLDALKLRERRRKHESRAAEMIWQAQDETDAASQAARSEMLGLLDTAVAGLGVGDRRAIVLRFYERKNFQEIGKTLGLSEEAARKRVTRATEKLRTFFAHRGRAASSAGVVAIVTSAWTRSTSAAPLHLAATAAHFALAVAPAGEIGVSAIADAVLHRLTMLQLRTILTVAASFTLVCTLSALMVHGLLARHSTTPPPVIRMNSD